MTCYTNPDDGREMVRCDHEGCSAFTHFANAYALQWDWFCGTLPSPRHFCKKHSRSEQYKSEFATSRLERNHHGN